MITVFSLLLCYIFKDGPPLLNDERSTFELKIGLETFFLNDAREKRQLQIADIVTKTITLNFHL